MCYLQISTKRWPRYDLGCCPTEKCYFLITVIKVYNISVAYVSSLLALLCGSQRGNLYPHIDQPHILGNSHNSLILWAEHTCHHIHFTRIAQCLLPPLSCGNFHWPASLVNETALQWLPAYLSLGLMKFCVLSFGLQSKKNINVQNDQVNEVIKRFFWGQFPCTSTDDMAAVPISLGHCTVLLNPKAKSQPRDKLSWLKSGIVFWVSQGKCQDIKQM